MPTNPKTKEKVSWRVFFKQWAEGMEKVTPLQQTEITMWGHLISGIGVVWGIIFSFRLAYYWMMVILLGGFIVLCVQALGNWQKMRLLKRMEDAYKLASIDLTEPAAFSIIKEKEVDNGDLNARMD